MKNVRKINDKLPKEIKECNINYIDIDDMVSITTFQKKYHNQILALKNKHPDEVKIVSVNKDIMVAHFPKEYLHVSIRDRAKRKMTDEQKAAAAERFRNMRAKRTKGTGSSE